MSTSLKNALNAAVLAIGIVLAFEFEYVCSRSARG